MASMIILVFLATLATIINYHIVYSVGHDNINVYFGSQSHRYGDLTPYLSIESPIAQAIHYNFSLEMETAPTYIISPMSETSITAASLWLAVRKNTRNLLENYFAQEATLAIRYAHNFTVLHKLVDLLTDRYERAKTDNKQVRKKRKKLYASLIYIITHEKGRLLLESKNEKQQTPLHLAISNNYMKVIEILIGAGASIHAKDGSGYTPLHYAASSRNKKMINLLMLYGAETNATIIR